jgi:hypothetical protein
VFTARGFHVVIGAEHHGGMFAGLGGFLSLDIWVAEEDAEDAAALLADLRDHDASADGGELSEDADQADGANDGGGDGDALDTTAGADEPAGDGDAAGARSGLSIEQRSARRRDTAYVLLLGCTISFGTAHMFTRAWGRGFALAGFQLLGLVQAVSGSTVGLVILIAAKLADVIGAMWRVRTAPTTALPVARIRRS